MKFTKAKTLKKASTATKKNGTLIIIGGNEDKKDEMAILREVARKTGSGKLIVATVASEIPEEVWADYNKIFRGLGVKNLEHLSVNQPDEARTIDAKQLFEGATAFFFSGGDQLKITTKLGGSPVLEEVYALFKKGGTVAGTSAGAAVMGKTMLVGGENAESHKVGNWMMAPGLGLLGDIIIDQHFAQRGRIGRLLGAVALNPGILGIGIDENTAIIVQDEKLEVIGTNAVYVVDGKNVSFTNVSEAKAESAMSIHDVQLHILSGGEELDLKTRRPKNTSHAHNKK